MRHYFTRFALAVLDIMLKFVRRVEWLLVRVKLIFSWRLQTKVPVNFDHRDDLTRAFFEPNRLLSTLGYCCARLKYERGSIVDLCCGSGFYTVMAFGDIGVSVYGYDIDDSALAIAKTHTKNSQVYFERKDITTVSALPADIGLIYWGSAWDYFTKAQRAKILGVIDAALARNGGIFVLSLPIHADSSLTKVHTEMHDVALNSSEVLQELVTFFEVDSLFSPEASERTEVLFVCRSRSS